jgi:hypothetical protein
MQATEIQLPITTEAEIEIEAPIVEDFHEGFAAPPTKLLILLGGGGLWFTGFFLMPAALLAGLVVALTGLSIVATSGYSLRRSGHSLISALRQLGGDLAEIMEDCSGGAAQAAREHILTPAQMAAEALAKRTGALTEQELGAIEYGTSSDLVHAFDHVFELILGTAGDGTNCAVLAGSKAGKTTFFHGLFHHLATRPGKKTLMIGDYNLGKDNGGGVPQWLGIPIYDREKHGSSPIGNFVIAPDDILSAIKHLDAIYEERIRVNADRAKAKKNAIKFDPIYFACDEFQSFMEHCSDADGKYVGEVAGKLLRARGLQIYFFPVLHNDKAEGYLNTTVLGSINLLIMGSLVSKLDSAPELQNSQKLRRFEPDAVNRVVPLRRELERELGKDGAVRSLAVLSLKHTIKTGDGTEFGDGTHLLKIPNCTKLLDVVWDWPEEIKAEKPQETIDTYFAARQMAGRAVVLTVREEVEDFGNLPDRLRDLVINHYAEFVAQSKDGKITRTKFFEVCKAHGIGRYRNSKDEAYRMICAIGDRFPDKLINLSELLAAMDGG